MLWGVEGVPTRAGLVDGGVNQAPCFQVKGVREGLVGGARARGGPKASGSGKGEGHVFFEGCPVMRGGRGGRPRALMPGEGVREGLAWRGKGSGGVQGLRFQGVGGRGTGSRDGANFATCVVFLLFLTRTKRSKMAFFEGCPVRWYPPLAGLVDGGVDQGVRKGLAWVGGVQELRFWGVGGRGRPQGRSKFRKVCRIFVVSNAYKKK